LALGNISAKRTIEARFRREKPRPNYTVNFADSVCKFLIPIVRRVSRYDFNKYPPKTVPASVPELYKAQFFFCGVIQLINYFFQLVIKITVSPII
jgi:hypothetical protein